METAVYLFTGFLEAGKTRFLQETLADANFFKGKDRTLVLLFEEGEEEYDFSTYPHQNVFLEILDQETVTAKHSESPFPVDGLFSFHLTGVIS